MREKVPMTNIFLVFCGGALGGACRYLLTLIPLVGATSWMTLFINFIGTFGLAALAVVLERRHINPERMQPLVGVGLLGGFTTFGALVMQSQALLESGHAFLAFALLLLSVFCGIIAVFLGRKMASLLPVKQRGGAVQ